MFSAFQSVFQDFFMHFIQDIVDRLAIRAGSARMRAVPGTESTV
jgi:hypothetical protein